MLFVKPLNNWDKITPEFPLAPISRPFDRAMPTLPMSGESMCSTSLAPDDIDKFIFVPVSPSGTGNTFSASTADAF